MKFILGLVCGLILGGTVYAQLGPHVPGPTGPSLGMDQQVRPGSMFPQQFMDLETGQITQMVPVTPRNPC